jgi:signal transduction histidine kinase
MEVEDSTASEIRPTLVGQLLEIHEYERQRMGQELHDSAGQLLVSLQLSVARLRAINQNCNPDSLIDEIQDTVRQIDQEIRALAFLHHPAELGSRNLCEAVQTLVAGFRRRTGIRTSFKCVGDQTAVAQSISVAMLRVAQEALVNVHRHSQATSAEVILERTANGVRLTISDNGIGIGSGASEGRGIGLPGMRDRMERHGGLFHVRNLKHGTKVTASMPVAT